MRQRSLAHVLFNTSCYKFGKETVQEFGFRVPASEDACKQFIIGDVNREHSTG